MQKIVPIVRSVLGLAFVVFGLNGFLEFMPPMEMTPEGNAFLVAIMDTGYLWQFVKVVEIVGGVLLLTNFMVPLALIILTPGVLNFVLFHAFLDPANIVPGGALFVLLVFLAWAYRDTWHCVLAPRVDPVGARG